MDEVGTFLASLAYLSFQPWSSPILREVTAKDQKGERPCLRSHRLEMVLTGTVVPPGLLLPIFSESRLDFASHLLPRPEVPVQ